jgi:hypothetical protein
VKPPGYCGFSLLGFTLVIMLKTEHPFFASLNQHLKSAWLFVLAFSPEVRVFSNNPQYFLTTCFCSGVNLMMQVFFFLELL